MKSFSKCKIRKGFTSNYNTLCFLRANLVELNTIEPGTNTTPIQNGISIKQWTYNRIEHMRGSRGGGSTSDNGFFRGGPNASRWGGGQHQYSYENPSIQLKTDHHLNCVSLVGRLWPNIECWLRNFVIFSRAWPVFLRKPIALWFSSWGGQQQQQ